MVPSASSGPRVLHFDLLYIRSVPNYSTRSPLDFMPADRIPPSDIFPRRSVIVEILSPRNNRERARNPCRHSRVC